MDGRPSWSSTNEHEQLLLSIALTAPVCTAAKEKLALSRRVDKHWRLIGWGEINRGVTIEPTKPQ